MRLRLALFLVLCALAPRSLGAQDSPSVDDLRPGMRVRFRAPAVSPDRFVGTVRWLTPDSIALDTPDHHLATVPRSPITNMEISLGASRWRGARRGVLWGLPVGAALGLFFTRKVDTCDFCADKPTSKGVAITTWVILSGVFGGGFGAANPSERWKSVPVPTAPVSPR